MTERQIRKRGYQQFYENLAFEVKKNPPSKLEKKLKLKSLPNNPPIEDENEISGD